MYLITHKKKITYLMLVLIFVLLFMLGACTVFSFTDGVITHTPLPSATATCPPNIQLSTPEGWKTNRRLTIVLFNPDAVGDQYFEMANGEKITNVYTFVKDIIPKLLGPSDHIAVFHLGFDTYEDARISNIGSDLEIPQFYNTPAPYVTVTPRHTPEKTPEAGLIAVKATNEAIAYQTQVAQINAENEAVYNCQTVLWNATAAADATAWTSTQKTENKKIEEEIIQDFKNFSMEGFNKTDETKNGGLYYGLSFATTILDAKCEEYDECSVIIIDDLSLWADNVQKIVDMHQDPELPDFLYPDLHGAKIYTIMPNCEDIDMPACQDLQNFWLAEFDKFGANPNVTFWNGKRIESRLLKEYQKNRR